MGDLPQRGVLVNLPGSCSPRLTCQQVVGRALSVAWDVWDRGDTLSLGTRSGSRVSGAGCLGPWVTRCHQRGWSGLYGPRGSLISHV